VSPSSGTSELAHTSMKLWAPAQDPSMPLESSELRVCLQRQSMLWLSQPQSQDSYTQYLRGGVSPLQLTDRDSSDSFAGLRGWDICQQNFQRWRRGLDWWRTASSRLSYGTMRMFSAASFHQRTLAVRASDPEFIHLSSRPRITITLSPELYIKTSTNHLTQL